MADPLSLSASIIALRGAAEGVSKTLAKLHELRNAPNELLALNNEISDLRIVLNDLERHFRRNANMPYAMEPLQPMSVLLQRGKDRLLQLDQLIQYKLLKPSSTPERVKVSWRGWIKAKRAVERHRQTLHDTRLNILTQMGVLNAYVHFSVISTYLRCVTPTFNKPKSSFPSRTSGFSLT